MGTQAGHGVSHRVSDLVCQVLAVLGLMVCGALLWIGWGLIVDDLTEPYVQWSGFGEYAWPFCVAPTAGSAIALGRYLSNGRGNCWGWA